MTRRSSPDRTRRAFAGLLTSLGIREFDMGGDVSLAHDVVMTLVKLHRRGAAIPPVVHISVEGLAGARTIEAGGTELAVFIATIDPAFATLQIAPDIRELFEPEDTLECILTHELGHYAHLLSAGIQRYLALSKRRFTKAEQRLFESAMEPDIADPRYWVRMFDNTDPCEFVAETFRAQSEGHALPDPLIRLYRRLSGPPPLV